MFFNIYKELFDDTPIPYLHIRLTTVSNENHTSLAAVVLECNKAYINQFISHKPYSFKTFINTPLSNTEKDGWEHIFNEAKKNKKYTLERFVDYLNQYLSITILYYKDNEYFLRLTKISNQNIKLSTALKNSPFPTWIKDRDGKYIDVNQSQLDTYNLEYKDIVGKTDFDFVEEDMAKSFKEFDDKVICENKMCRYECKFPKNNGDIEYYDVVKWPYMDDSETFILGTIGIGINTSEAMILRKQLEDTEKRFLEIANNINEIIIIRDDTKAEYINPAFEKVYGFKPDKLYKDINTWYEYWDNIEFEGVPNEYNFTQMDESKFKVNKYGQDDIWIWSRFVPVLDYDGSLIKKIGILSDITEVKKAQLEIDRMKMDFFANLSHELRTPINLILSSLQVLYLKLGDLNPEMYDYFHTYLGILSQNGQRLLKLVNNLIDTTKLDAGCFEHNPTNGDIISCVEDICQSITSFVNVNDLDIIFDTNEEEKIINFDPDNMERIILNLLSNAIKFNKPNGKIEVTITCNDNVQISVKDSGIGIPEDKLDSIFGRFEQVKSKLKKEREGSGIGLSLVKSLVEMHNGNIELLSTYGEGSEFIITLPNILSNSENLEPSKSPRYLCDINKMKIELSDIYI